MRARAAVLLLLGAVPREGMAHGFGGGGALHWSFGPSAALALLVLGAWRAQLAGRRGQLVEAGLLLGLLLGWAVAHVAPDVPVAPGVALAILLLGVAMGPSRQQAAAWGGFGTGILALCHGHKLAHHTDTVANGSAFLLTTFSLYAGGAAAAVLLLHQTPEGPARRAIGWGVTLLGLVLLLRRQGHYI